eukprot:3630193-Prymnesium_polylepis.1
MTERENGTVRYSILYRIRYTRYVKRLGCAVASQRITRVPVHGKGETRGEALGLCSRLPAHHTRAERKKM